jgi:hypothetical protein
MSAIDDSQDDIALEAMTGLAKVPEMQCLGWRVFSLLVFLCVRFFYYLLIIIIAVVALLLLLFFRVWRVGFGSFFLFFPPPVSD